MILEGARTPVGKFLGGFSDVSTVDTADSPFGRVATAYALVEQIAGGSGQYGSGDAADSPLPEFRGAPAPPKKK